MTLFIEKTWLLWWMFAVVLILRWFHVSSTDADAGEESRPIASTKGETSSVHSQLASRA
jgi:hypothetical protein